LPDSLPHSTPDLVELHHELKALIVDTLALEDVTPAEIETDAPLFVEGLGLDSIDALEIAMVLEERYAVTLDDDPETNERIFQSVKSLGEFVAENRVR
jgi:acyl carrier protein